MISPAKRLAELSLGSKKSLGQHFLHDRRIVERICNAAGIEPTTRVVEIGPGLGILTEELARRAASVIALEKDTQLASALSATSPENVIVRNEDALTVDLEPDLRATLYPGSKPALQRCDRDSETLSRFG